MGHPRPFGLTLLYYAFRSPKGATRLTNVSKSGTKRTKSNARSPFLASPTIPAMRFLGCGMGSVERWKGFYIVECVLSCAMGSVARYVCYFGAKVVWRFSLKETTGWSFFSCSPTKICVGRSPLGIFRVAIPTQPHLERPRHEARKTMYRSSVRHVSQRGWVGSVAQNSSLRVNPLCANGLRHSAENGVFAPNASIVEKNSVDSNIDCRHNSGLSYIGSDNDTRVYSRSDVVARPG